MGVGQYVNNKFGCDFEWGSREAGHIVFIYLRIGQSKFMFDGKMSVILNYNYYFLKETLALVK